MNKHLIGLLAAATIITAGCQTAPEKTDVTYRIESITRTATFIGAATYLLNHPEDRLPFVLAKDAVAALVDSGRIDPLALREAVAGLPVSELRSDRTAIVVAATMLLLDDLQLFNWMDTPAECAAAADGILSGLTMALTMVGE